MDSLRSRIGIDLPIIQAPMAGVSTPAMAAAVSNAGALGSIGVGAMDRTAAGEMIAAVKALTDRPFNVNVFCHRPAVRDREREAAWLARLAPVFARFGAEPPGALREIYRSFVDDDEMLALLLEERPRVVSFHFGLPASDRIVALRKAGILLFATATSLAEARRIAALGIDAVIAQGYEAGGHRGVFDPDAPDACLGTVALTRLLVREQPLPVIASGGIMDGAGIAASMLLGASLVQLGTAFVACSESAADAGFRAALQSPAAYETVMTRVISGRPARCLANLFTKLGEGVSPAEVPAYPVAYDAGKALHAAARARGESGFGAHLAGQGAPLVRPMAAGELVGVLKAEMEALEAPGPWPTPRSNPRARRARRTNPP